MDLLPGLDLEVSRLPSRNEKPENQYIYLVKMPSHYEEYQEGVANTRVIKLRKKKRRR